MQWGEMTFGEMMSQLNGNTAYKFEVVEGNVQLKVDGLMGSLKRSSAAKTAKLVSKKSKESKPKKQRAKEESHKKF